MKTKSLFDDEGTSPPESPPQRDELFRLAAAFEVLRVEDLRSVYRSFTGKLIDPKLRKKDLTVAVASILDFKDQVDFNAFYESLPPLLREAIEIGTFFRYVSIPPLEKKYGSPILSVKKDYGYLEGFELNPHLRLDFFDVIDEETLNLPRLYRSIFARWLQPPSGRDPTPIPPPEAGIWSNVDFLREAANLMGSLAAGVLVGQYGETIARKGLSKTEIKKFRTTCGQREFPIAGKLGLDPIDLFVRLAACVKDLSKKLVQDGDAYIKQAVNAFLNPPLHERGPFRLDGWTLEYLVLTDHLSRRPGYSVNSGYEGPPSRAVLSELLKRIGKTRDWYGTADLYRSILIRDEIFQFIDTYDELRGYQFRVDSLAVAGGQLLSDPYDRFLEVEGRVREATLGLPLLKAYCYVLALLGVVEICETEPECPVEKKGRALPISPYDAVRAVRVTEFGAWCLGLVKEKPPLNQGTFEALADEELLLVTFRGKSIERRLFLETIGTKLGLERYRITEASFIRGCERLRDIDQRIENFKRLIDPEPSPRWKEFFETLRARVNLFTTPVPALLYTLPKDPTLIRAVVSDPVLRSLVLRAEGGTLVVRAADQRRFMKALADIGYFNEEL